MPELVRCNTSSSNGDTRSAANLIKNFLDAENIEYEEVSACKTMPNIISTTNMAKSGKHLMLNGHLDVMPAGNEPGWSVNPYSGTIKDGKIIGRGTSDMKAGVTAMLFTYKYLQRFKNELSGKLSLTSVSDEETGWGRGTGFLFKKIPEHLIRDLKELENFPVEIPSELREFLDQDGYREMHEKVRAADIGDT